MNMDLLRLLTQADFPTLLQELRLSQKTYERHHVPAITCVNDFRLFQNRKKTLPLTSLANITIHNNIVPWKGKLDPFIFILNLNIPKHLLVIILLEYLSCEKHNFFGHDKEHTSQLLFNYSPEFKFLSNNFFGKNSPYPFPSHRFFSQSIWMLLFLENFLETHGIPFFLAQVSEGNLSHESIYHKLLYEICAFPTNHCPELPLFKLADDIQCPNTCFHLASYTKQENTYDRFFHRKMTYTCSGWKKTKPITFFYK